MSETRFLDVRAGFYPTTEERFWLVHGIIKAHPMMEGIQDVKTFLANTREIVVWEINTFEQYWDAEAHQEFKSLLVSEFSAWLVTPGDYGWDTPLSDVWARAGLAAGQGRIIITYNCQYTDPAFFFREINEKWGNVDEPQNLYNYINGEVSKHRLLFILILGLTNAVEVRLQMPEITHPPTVRGNQTVR